MTELLERGPLLAALTAARERGGELVFVGDEAGVGKTALVALLRELAPGGVAVRRTCIGRTRQRSTPCATSAGGWTRPKA